MRRRQKVRISGSGRNAEGIKANPENAHVGTYGRSTASSAGRKSEAMAKATRSSRQCLLAVEGSRDPESG